MLSVRAESFRCTRRRVWRSRGGGGRRVVWCGAGVEEGGSGVKCWRSVGWQSARARAVRGDWRTAWAGQAGRQGRSKPVGRCAKREEVAVNVERTSTGR